MPRRPTSPRLASALGAGLALLLVASPASAQSQVAEPGRETALQRLVLQHLIHNNHAHAPPPAPGVVCVGLGMGWEDKQDPPPWMLEEFDGRDRPVLPWSACHLDREFVVRDRLRPRFVRRTDGEPALGVYVGVPRIEGTRAVVDGGYYEDVLSGAVYECRVERTDGRWRVVACDLMGISDP